jgi:uncharacterized protein DUF3553
MLRKGDLVRHASMPSWGIGSVRSAPRGGNLLVRFDMAGDKLMHSSCSALTKVPKHELMYLVVREIQVKKGRSVVTVQKIPVIRQEP